MEYGYGDFDWYVGELFDPFPTDLVFPLTFTGKYLNVL